MKPPSGHNGDDSLFDWADKRQQDAIEATNEGIERAQEHAERVDPGWNERAFGGLVAYAEQHSEFTCERAREVLEANGLPLPPDKRAWGGVVRRAVVAGVIERIGYDHGKDPKVHRTIQNLWKSLV